MALGRRVAALGPAEGTMILVVLCPLTPFLVEVGGVGGDDPLVGVGVSGCTDCRSDALRIYPRGNLSPL